MPHLNTLPDESRWKTKGEILVEAVEREGLADCSGLTVYCSMGHGKIELERKSVYDKATCRRKLPRLASCQNIALSEPPKMWGYVG